MFMRDCWIIRPATRKIQNRGPAADKQARREPVPESFRLVTRNTCGVPLPLRPLPPSAAAPPPSAFPSVPWKAGHDVFVQATKLPVPPPPPVVGFTRMLADADFVGSETLVAVMIAVAAVDTEAGGV